MSNVGVSAFGWHFPVWPASLFFDGVPLTGNASDFEFQLIHPITPSLSIIPLPLSSYEFGQLFLDPFNSDNGSIGGNHFTLAPYKGLRYTSGRTTASDLFFT